ncbi:hypothetical protein B2J93_3673 [Marssonina coronariae]|uniref:SGNH hydrolase-type esterase domain-containing protein n=1 Tax=Diplocarpon coronariae TaxID=2795749 RepID=A0A218Z4U2_9HELO|nr:hypothetical protein B2J93_3673 [Marssonina coronariae]
MLPPHTSTDNAWLDDEVHPHDPYDWAIILGGTNDLNQNRLPDNIFSTLQKVWDVPLSKNTKVLALTISGCGMCSTEVDSRTIDLNQRILNHEAENYYTYDLYEAMPYWEMDKEMRDEVWDDNIHFTAKGYDMIGKLLADQLFEIMQKAEDELYTSYAAKDDLRRRKTEVMAR